MIQLVPIEKVRPSTYNPRQADPARLDVIETSLRKLGFILPIYADESGEILSGHQRHYVALRMGAAHVPVAYTKPMDLEERKAVNIAFNRGTNDLAPSDTPRSMTEALQRSDFRQLAARIPDKVVNGPDFYRCAKPSRVPLAPLLAANRGRWVEYACTVSKTLRRKGIVMPVVATPDLKVVNGVGRLQMMAEEKLADVDVVFITPDEAALADAMLNLLSMDFDIHHRYADLLRWNSTGAKPLGRQRLGRCYTFAILGSQTSVNFDVKRPEDKKRWVSFYGNCVCDFGAGLMAEANMLCSVGVDVSAFEPYCCRGSRHVPDVVYSRQLCREFLKSVASGKRFTSIFMSAVLNSVPFIEDRRHIVYILSALASPLTKVYSCSSSRKQAGYQIAMGKEFVNKNDAARTQFRLDYEPGVTLSNIGAYPMMQKYHRLEEFCELFRERFTHVEGSESSNNVEVVASGPRPIDPQRLRTALEFEFNLPFPQNQRFGMSGEAVPAFSKRLCLSL